MGLRTSSKDGRKIQLGIHGTPAYEAVKSIMNKL